MIPQRIMVIGSSSIGENGSGTLGKALKNQLVESDIHFFAKSGAGFNTFAGTAAQRAALEAQIKLLAPGLVLVVMGGNPTGTAVALGDMMQWLKTTVGSIGGGSTSLLWVGPPVYADASTQNITKLYDNVGPRVLGKAYVSSQPWTSPTTGRTADKVHFTEYGASLWGQKIVDWVQSSLTPAPVAALGIGLVLAGLGAFLWFKRRRSGN